MLNLLDPQDALLVLAILGFVGGLAYLYGRMEAEVMAMNRRKEKPL